MASCKIQARNENFEWGEPRSHICWAGVKYLLNYTNVLPFQRLIGTPEYWPPGAKDEFDIKGLRLGIEGTSNNSYKELVFHKCREWFADYDDYIPFDEWEKSYMESSYIDTDLTMNAHTIFAILTMLRYPFELETLLVKTQELQPKFPDISWDVLFYIVHMCVSHNSNHGMFRISAPRMVGTYLQGILRNKFKENVIYSNSPQHSIEKLRSLGGKLHGSTEPRTMPVGFEEIVGRSLEESVYFLTNKQKGESS